MSSALISSSFFRYVSLSLPGTNRTFLDSPVPIPIIAIVRHNAQLSALGLPANSIRTRTRVLVRATLAHTAVMAALHVPTRHLGVGCQQIASVAGGHCGEVAVGVSVASANAVFQITFAALILVVSRTNTARCPSGAIPAFLTRSASDAHLSVSFVFENFIQIIIARAVPAVAASAIPTAVSVIPIIVIPAITAVAVAIAVPIVSIIVPVPIIVIVPVISTIIPRLAVYAKEKCKTDHEYRKSRHRGDKNSNFAADKN